MGGTRLRPVGEGGHIIEDEGVPLAQQPALNFIGAGVTAADAPGKTNVTIPGGAGGAWVKVAEVELSVNSDTINIPISPSILMSDVAQIKVIGKVRMDGSPDVLRYEINNLGALNGQHNSVGLSFKTGDVAVSLIDSQDADFFGSGLAFPDFDGTSFDWILYGNETLQGFNGYIRESGGRESYANYNASWNTPMTTLTNLKIFTTGFQGLVLGSKASVWKLPL